jgi:hypothetical protein
VGLNPVPLLMVSRDFWHIKPFQSGARLRSLHSRLLSLNFNCLICFDDCDRFLARLSCSPQLTYFPNDLLVNSFHMRLFLAVRFDCLSQHPPIDAKCFAKSNYIQTPEFQEWTDSAYRLIHPHNWTIHRRLNHHIFLWSLQRLQGHLGPSAAFYPGRHFLSKSRYDRRPLNSVEKPTICHLGRLQYILGNGWCQCQAIVFWYCSVLWFLCFC